MDFSGFLENGAVNIVVFGDSVTHGARNGYNDYENVYHNVLKKKIETLEKHPDLIKYYSIKHLDKKRQDRPEAAVLKL